MRFPRLVRKFWLPALVVLVLVLIVSQQMREPFTGAATNSTATTSTAARNPCGTNRCDVYGNCPADFSTTMMGTNRCNSMCHDGGSNNGICPAGSTRVTPNSNTDKRCKKARLLKAGCTAPA